MGNNLDAYRAAIGLFRALDMDLSDKISTALNGVLDM
jgi:hypothetical protein